MKKKQWIAVCILSVALCCAAALALWPKNEDSSASQSASLQVEQPAPYPDETKPKETADGRPLVPNFALLNEEGERVQLSDYAGRGVVINFWASWCSWCDKEMASFEKLAEQYADGEGPVILMINVTDGKQETMDTAKAYFDKKGFTHLTPLFDPDLYATSVFGASSLPMTFTVDKDGYLKGSHTGYAEYDELKALADEVA